MRTFLNVPLLGINRTFQMVAHHSCVVPYPLMIICHTVIGTFEEWRLAAENLEQRNSSTDLKRLTENGRAGRRVGPQRRNPGVHGGAKGVDREAHIVQTGHHQGDFRKT